MTSHAAIVLIAVLVQFCSCAAQDAEIVSQYETPVYKVAFEDGFLVKVYSFDDVLDGVENKASQLAEFTLPLEAVPGAKLVATAMAEWNVSKVTGGGGDLDLGQATSSAAADMNETSTEDDEQVEGGFDDDVVTELEKEISDREKQHKEPLFSNQQQEILSKMVQGEVERYVKERSQTPPPAEPAMEDSSMNKTIQAQTASSFNIELLFVVDYSVYIKFLARDLLNPVVAVENLRAYYSGIVLATNARLASAATGATTPFALTISLSGLIVADSPSASPWTQNIDTNFNINPILPSTAFNAFAAGLNPTVPHDAAVLFTRANLVTPTGQAPGYIAAPSLLCSLVGNIWITDNQEESTSLYLARYIGDSLGIQGDGPNGCSDQDLFIMTSLTIFPTNAALASNPWRFSTCSATEIRTQLPTNAFTCTTALQNSSPFNTALYTTQPLGQRFNADIQCSNTANNDGRLCRERYVTTGLPYSALCYNLLCDTSLGQSQCVQTIAHDGTTCASGSFCVQGVCVPSPLAPITPPNCPQGDNPISGCTLASCANPITAATVCCATCSNVLQATTPRF